MASSATAIRLRNRRNWLLHAFLRVPLLLYRTPFRYLLGRWYLVVKHRGRRTGKVYSTVLDIQHIDKDTGDIYVSSGWGTGADWWRNLKASPALEVRIGGKRFVPEQRFLDKDEACKIRRLVWKKHPIMSRITLLTTNYPSPKIDKDLRQWASDMPFVAFRATGAGISSSSAGTGLLR